MAPEYIPVLVALLAALPGLLALRSQQRKADAEAVGTLAEATSELLDDLRQDARTLREQIAEQNQIIQRLRESQSAQQETLDRALLRVDALETERAALLERIRMLEADLEAVREENHTLRCDNRELVAAIARREEAGDGRK